MKIIIPGGIGQIGDQLTGGLVAAGHKVIVLTRNPRESPGTIIYWDGRTLGPWADEFHDADAVVNLAGRSVNCRYNDFNRRLIMDSRINSTRVLGEAIAAARRPPRVWLQSSTATIYSHRFDAPNDDLAGVLGGNEPNLPDTWRFSYGVANAWERTCMDAPTPGTRKVLLRTAMVMNNHAGGTFDLLRYLAKFGLGGRIGDGKQFMSWIHGHDFVRAMLFLIEHEELDGAVNVSSPNPLPQAEFMRELRGACGMPFGLPAAKWMLEVGVFLMQSESELILKSRRVVPRRLIDAGFTLDFPVWGEAARALCASRGR